MPYRGRFGRKSRALPSGMPATLNPYVWEMYLNSFHGQLALEYFDRLDNFADRADLVKLFLGVSTWIDIQSTEGNVWEDVPLDEESTTYIEAVRVAALEAPVASTEQVQQLLAGLVNSGAVKLSDEEGDVLTLREPFSKLTLLSLGLHLAHPDVFLPYGFTGRYYLILRVAEAFGIPLPPVAPKNNRLARWLYYGKMCAAFQEFRQLHGMTLSELLAFMYDFSVNYVYKGVRTELPEPRNAWLLIGGVDNGDLASMETLEDMAEHHWQGNLDMRRGDVCIMYIRKPLSSIHSLWRVVEDAYVDPFFHYKQAVQISRPKRLPNLHFREIADDSLMGGNQYVKARLQGASGKILTHGEYERLLQMMVVKGDLPEGTPHFTAQEAVDLTLLGSERDVEQRLVEPLLRRAGLENSDWVRQLLVRTGRSERVYPDYAIGLTGDPPKQRVRALVEVKYRAAGERDWQEAFHQARSYGLLLGARVIVTAAAEGVRIYPRRNDDFDFAQGEHHHWSGLQDGEVLWQLSRFFRSRS